MPPRTLLSTEQAQGEKPAPQMGDSRADVDCRRQHGAAIAIVLRGLVHSLHTVGLWEQLGAITAHEKKGTGLGK